MTSFVKIPENPIPKGADIAEFKTRDGALLRYAFFPKKNARGTIVLQAGWSEFIEKYFETADDLRNRGYAVAMMDWRGQGLSDRDNNATREWTGYFQTLRDDLREFTDAIVVAQCPGPYYLMTHSMGGLPGLMLLASGYDKFQSAVLCAPMTRLFTPATGLIIRAGANLASTAGMANADVGAGSDDSRQFDGNMFTSDRRRHDRFRLLQEAEPRAALTSPTYGWVREAFRGSKEIHSPNYFKQLNTPLLIVAAGDEQRIDATDYANLTTMSPLISTEVIESALHEIMMERDELRDSFLTKAVDFLEAA